MPAQQPPDDVSNTALCQSGPTLVELTGRAGMERRHRWAILRPVRVKVEDLAKFLTAEATLAHANSRSCTCSDS
jgi:hypothetical protein